jgi:hypothetical protein
MFASCCPLQAGKRDLASMPAGIKFSKHGSIQATAPAAQQAGRDIEAGVDSGDGAKPPARSNMGCASAFLTRLLLLCGLGRGNFNVGNNTQLAAARKRLAPSYAATVGCTGLRL